MKVGDSVKCVEVDELNVLELHKIYEVEKEVKLGHLYNYESQFNLKDVYGYSFKASRFIVIENDNGVVVSK